jgi:hypothetical protein
LSGALYCIPKPKKLGLRNISLCSGGWAFHGGSMLDKGWGVFGTFSVAAFHEKSPNRAAALAPLATWCSKVSQRHLEHQ